MDSTTTYTLTIIDTTGIQEYIFGSNRLRENIGASQQVSNATGAYVQQALQDALAEAHVDLSKEPPLESTPNQRCEVIYAGGGNVLLLFRTLADAKATVRELSRLLHIHAPGLRIAAAHHEFNWATEDIGLRGSKPGVLAHLYEQLGQRKQFRLPDATPLALGVTLACTSTGLPAVARDKDDPDQDPPRFISAPTVGKRNARADADTHFRNLLEEIPTQYAIPKDFDDLGRSRDQQSYIAVVHIDGNGMGKRFEQAGASATTNRAFITAVRDLSAQVNKASQEALSRTLEALNACFLKGQGTLAAQQIWYDTKDQLLRSLSRDKDPPYLPFLPFRPLVFGGDDVTFVCDGRLGLALAHCFIHEFEQATSTLPQGGTAYACAGVAIVKSHYPFARAYALAADLCQNAKRALRKDEIKNCSALDWHIVASGRTDSISEIRKREYAGSKPNDTLTARPLLLCDLPPDHKHYSDWQHRTWAQLRATVYQFNYSDEWRERRNKVIALREVLRQGADAVDQFKVRYKIETPLPHDNHAVLFDAIETMEFLLPLEPPVLDAEEQTTHA